MLDIEEQLRRYGAAVEHDLLTGTETPTSSIRQTRGRSRRWLAIAAAVAVGIVGAAVLSRPEASNETAVIGEPSHLSIPDGRPASPLQTGSRVAGAAGVFTTPTGTVLLFSDGIDGVTAVDLDRRLVGRRVIEGERAGDQPFRLTLTGGHLIVGWGDISAAPLDGGSSTVIDTATIYIPASEPGEVWTVTWDGGAIGQGSAQLRRIGIDGVVTVASTPIDTETNEPLLGVPGGLAINTPDGLAIWDPATANTGAPLTTEQVSALASNGTSLAWCDIGCANVGVVALTQPGEPTAPHVSFTGNQLAFAADGSKIAVIRESNNGAEVVLIDPETLSEEIVADDVDAAGGLMWAADSQQLLYTENSYQQPTMRVGRYNTADSSWEIHTLPVGEGLTGIALTPEQAVTFFSDELVSDVDCPGAGLAFPSGRTGVCSFAFFTPDSADECVSSGNAAIVVPDTIGLDLADAQIVAQAAGLNVVDQGLGVSTDPDDPEAVVAAQEPPPGTAVPIGACVGFRTTR